MKRTIKNEGISPIMATILLVAIAAVAFVFVFVWSKGFAQESLLKFNEPIENSCSKISFDASLSGNRNEIYINNLGEVPIYGFNVHVLSEETSLIKFVGPNDGNIYAGESDSLILDTTIPSYMKVSITPGLLGEGEESGSFKIYVCESKAMELQ